ESDTVQLPVETDEQGDPQHDLSSGPIVTDTETRDAAAAAEASDDRVLLTPRPGAPTLRIPVLEMQPVESNFSLNDITNLDPFRTLGERLAHDPDDELRRELLTAEIRLGADGLRETVVSTESAEDPVASAPTLIPLDDAKQKLVDLILSSPVVPARPTEKKPAERVVDEFVKGIGVDAPSILSRYLGRAGARLVKLVNRDYKKFLSKPNFEKVLAIVDLTPTRFGRPTTSNARTSKFQRGVGYIGWSKRSMFEQVWFDSGTELAVANILDGSSDITHWVRLHRGDLPILWSSGGSWYHPDFIAADSDGTHWVIEVKSNCELENEDVQEKRAAAQRWANYVSTDSDADGEWRYLLVSEDDVASAKSHWTALQG